MKAYTKIEIEEISQILSSQNNIILIHSALQNLGKLAGENFLDIPKIWLEIMMNYFDNLIMPCFNYSFPKTKIADLRILKSEVGVLSEVFRNHSTTRSTHPIFGFCGIGTEISEILKPNQIEHNPFCKESVYGRLWDKNALMVFLGIDIRVCTFMVFVEAMYGVRYRYFKPFFGKVIGDFGEIRGDFYHFCLPLAESLKVNFFRIQEEMIANGIIKKQVFGGSKVYYFCTKPFLEYVIKRLQEEPFILLQEAPKHFYIFKDGKESVMA